MPLFKAWRNKVAEELADQLSSPFDPESPFQDYYFDPDGRTLLDAMLSADPQLTIPSRPSLRQAVCDRAALESSELGGAFRAWNGETIAELFRAALDIVVDHCRTENNKEPAVVGFKEVWTLEFASPLAKAFPEARFLVIHRDPRAIIASLIAMMEKDPSQAAHTVSYMRHWRKNVAIAHYLANIPQLAGRVMSLRFEDLVSQPEPMLRTVCDFIGLPFDNAMLTPGLDEQWKGNSSFGTMKSGFDAAVAHHWRDRLASNIVDTVEYHCGPEMDTVGYAPSNPVDGLSNTVRQYVLEANQHPGKWRSDSGDIYTTLDWEKRRWELLASSASETKEIQAGFLFESFFKTIINENSPRQTGTL